MLIFAPSFEAGKMNTLTELIRYLPISSRVKARRRIERMARYFADRLEMKHGKGEALVIMRRRLVFCAQGKVRSIRYHVWCRVWSYLRGLD